MKPRKPRKPTMKDLKPRKWQRPPVTVKQRRNRKGEKYFEVVGERPAPKPWVWGRG